MALIFDYGGNRNLVEAIMQHHKPPIEVVRNPDSQAVQLLRELVTVRPFKYDESGFGTCIYCGSDDAREHEPDCAYTKAKAFLAALDVK